MQDRLVKELALANIKDKDTANHFIKNIYLPDHNKRFAIKPDQSGSAFVPVAGESWRDVLSIQEERIVGNDNTVRFEGRILQIPAVAERVHFVRAKIRVHKYPDGSLAVFHGPRRLGNYTQDGNFITKEKNKTIQSQKAA